MREKKCLECRWVSVVDAAGRRRLEMRWIPPVVATRTETPAQVQPQVQTEMQTEVQVQAA